MASHDLHPFSLKRSRTRTCNHLQRNAETESLLRFSLLETTLSIGDCEASPSYQRPSPPHRPAPAAAFSVGLPSSSSSAKEEAESDIHDLAISFAGLEEKVLEQYTVAKANLIRIAAANYLLDSGVQWGSAPQVKVRGGKL